MLDRTCALRFTKAGAKSGLRTAVDQSTVRHGEKSLDE
jgi:hypothetical protein